MTVQDIDAAFGRALKESTEYTAKMVHETHRERADLIARGMLIALMRMLANYAVLPLKEESFARLRKHFADIGVQESTIDELLALDHASPEYQSYATQLLRNTRTN